MQHLELIRDEALTESYHRNSFECRRPLPNSRNSSTFGDFHKLCLHKEEFFRHSYTDHDATLCVHWFRPRRIRTGLERIYCVLSWGHIGTEQAYYIDYCGGTGLNKTYSAFYSVLWKMGIELYKNGAYTTEHYAPIYIIPALIRCLYAGTPHTTIGEWKHTFYGVD